MRARGEVKITWMLMTGTREVAPVSDTEVALPPAVFPALLPGSKYELVLQEAERFAFTDVILPGREGRRNPAHYRAILALSIALPLERYGSPGMACWAGPALGSQARRPLAEEKGASYRSNFPGELSAVLFLDILKAKMIQKLQSRKGEKNERKVQTG